MVKVLHERVKASGKLWCIPSRAVRCLAHKLPFSLTQCEPRKCSVSQRSILLHTCHYPSAIRHTPTHIPLYVLSNNKHNNDKSSRPRELELL